MRRDGRQPLPIGTYGNVATKKQPHGSWRASARFRDMDGVTRNVSRRGPTKAAAQNNLKGALKDRIPPSDASIHGGMRTTKLAEVWLAELEFDDSKAQQTKEKYAGIVRAVVIPRLGDVTVRELNVPIIDAVLRSINETQHSNAKHTQIVLKAMLGLAVRHGAIIANPVLQVASLPRRLRHVVALDDEGIQAMRDAIDNWENSNSLGPPRNAENLRDFLSSFSALGLESVRLWPCAWKILTSTHPRSRSRFPGP